MPELEIVPADTGRARREFLELPYQLYARDPVWVAPLIGDQKRMLNRRKHPFYQHAEIQTFLARRGRECTGRIAAIVDRLAAEDSGRRVGNFGFFESVDDVETASRLVDGARAWLRERGMHLMRGPVNPSYNYGGSVLVEGFTDPPAIGVPYNPPYYDRLLTRSGLHAFKDFQGFRLSRDDLQKAQTLAGRFGAASSGARLRPFDRANWEREVQLIHELHSRGFTRNFDFAPLSLDEVREISRDIKRYGDEHFVQFCEVEGRAAGLVIALPDWNQALRLAHGRLFPLGWWRIWRASRAINRIRIFLVLMAPEWQGTGLAGAFLSLVDQPGAKQYTDVDATWVVEGHPIMFRLLAMLGARSIRRYRVYEGDVAGPGVGGRA